MNVHLTDEQREFVQQRVAAGSYASASEVIRAGLRALKQDECWREEVRARITKGIAEAKLGQLLDGDDVFQELVKRIDDHRQKNP